MLPLAIVPAQIAEKSALPRYGEGRRKVDLGPTCSPLDVRPPAPPLNEMEVKKRLPAEVEDAGLLLDDPVPPTYLVQHIGEIFEVFGRAVRHGALIIPRR
jgi:hypothetical protein